MVSETKPDDSFLECQFLIERFHSPFRFGRNRNYALRTGRHPSQIVES